MSDLAQQNTPKLFPEISVVIPVYNEEECLETLFTRLTQVMDSLNKTYEIILINDGSRDRSSLILHELYQKRPENMVILEFNRNYGQHMAIMAGFEKSRGEVVVTMDADLQNLPEDIPLLLTKIDEGHDVVGGIRTNRQDKLWRITVSKLHNWLREKLTKINMVDEGCMLRAYKKSIVKAMVESDERSTFIPALAVTYASNPTDIKVRHAERLAGETGYNLYKLIRYNFDFFANFSRAPLEAFTLIGVTISLLSVLLFIYLMIRRMVHGPDVEGMFTLFAIQFFLTGILLMGLGIVGEYVGRIYEEVRQRPRYIIKTYLSASPIDQESKVKFSAPAQKKTSKTNKATTATKKIEKNTDKNTGKKIVKKSENLNKNKNKKQENKSANQSKGE